MGDPGRIQSHRDLKVWQLGMEIAESVYALTARFPQSELYGITSQMRRAAVSVPANIAEGNARSSTKEYLRHLSVALGSLAELETFSEIARRLNYGTEQDIDRIMNLLAEERRMLRGLQRSLRLKLNDGSI